MKGKRKLILSVLFVAVMTSLLAVPIFAKPKLNRKGMVITEKDSLKLKVTGTKKKPKWSSSNKKIATVSKKGVVKGCKAGSATITAKVGGKKLKCKVTVIAPPSMEPIYENTNNSVSNGATVGYGSFVQFFFYQNGWYIARFAVETYNKQTGEYQWVYSDSATKGQRIVFNVNVDGLKITRVGYQIWAFGWDHMYYYMPWIHAGQSDTFYLSGYGDHPQFSWKEEP